MADLKADEMVEFQITFADGTTEKLRAAYPTSDEKLPGWTLLKDHRHKTVAMIPHGVATFIRVAQPA